MIPTERPGYASWWEQAGGFRCKGDLVFRIPALKGRNLSPFFPQRFRACTFPSPGFSWKVAAGSVRPFKGVSSFVAHFWVPQRAAQLLRTRYVQRPSRCARCNEGLFCRFSDFRDNLGLGGVTSRWRARPPLMLTSQNVSEPLLQWRKKQMESGAPLWVSRTFFLFVSRDGKPKCDRVCGFRLT